MCAQDYLAAYILEDMASLAPRFERYYALLPRAHPNMPLFWPPRDVAALAPSHVHRALARARAGVAATYAAIAAAAPAFGAAHTLAEFEWAWATVSSRNFFIAGLHALVPLIDFANHGGPSAGALWDYDKEGRAFTVSTLRAHGAGEALLIDYGAHCNSYYLLYYGVRPQAAAGSGCACSSCCSIFKCIQRHV